MFEILFSPIFSTPKMKAGIFTMITLFILPMHLINRLVGSTPFGLPKKALLWKKKKCCMDPNFFDLGKER